ncbi:WXG100 family type VII secretion target [Streptacidiphilus carbonis]|uniref:WXG100 family type VII secretion target n=1 Tax=Streptacidiphilus carbonis TaxID=105422 RepID=UPI0005A910D2|nr:WXG100 family type VII secretion target [Streptacidiphilus carbonis]
MSGQFRTTADEMRAFSGRISDVNAQIQAELSRLESLVSSITSGWQGSAAQSYNTLQQRWNADAGKLNKVLNEIKEAIDATTASYSGTEQDQQSSMSKIASALG